MFSYISLLWLLQLYQFRNIWQLRQYHNSCWLYSFIGDCFIINHALLFRVGLNAEQLSKLGLSLQWSFLALIALFLISELPLRNSWKRPSVDRTEPRLAEPWPGRSLPRWTTDCSRTPWRKSSSEISGKTTASRQERPKGSNRSLSPLNLSAKKTSRAFA